MQISWNSEFQQNIANFFFGTRGLIDQIKQNIGNTGCLSHLIILYVDLIDK